MDRTRTFIAVEISPAVCSRAAEIINRLSSSGADVTWVKPKNLHVTLKFLNEIPNIEIVQVCRTVEAAVKDFEPFEMVYRGIGAFPDIQNPKTVWMGVDQGAEQIIELQARIDEAMKKLRFPREPRKFQPHLTLGRVKGSGPEVAELSRLIQKFADFDGDVSIVDEVVTLSSDRAPGGPTYERLGHTDLGSPTHAQIQAKKKKFALDDDDDDDLEEFDEAAFDAFTDEFGDDEEDE